MDKQDAVRTLAKWLNEKQVAPIDRVALATVLSAWNRRAEMQVPEGYKLIKAPITEEMHVAACKVLLRSFGLDGTPQRMLDAMLAAAPEVKQ